MRFTKRFLPSYENIVIYKEGKWIGTWICGFLPSFIGLEKKCKNENIDKN